MALANVTQEILKAADEKAAAIKAEADAEIAKIRADADAKVATIIENPKALMSEKDSFTAADLGVFSVEKDSRIAAGLILQSEDGQMEVDMQYSTILQSIWDREIKTVSNILFG